MSLQGSALFRVTPALSIRPMAYYNTFDELTNGYDNARYDSQNNYQSFSQDAHTRIAGTGAQILYRMGESLLTVAVDGHQEGYDANGFEVSLTGDRDPIDTTKTIETVSASAEQELKFSDRLTAVIGAGYAEQLRETASDSDYTYLAGTRYVLTETTALRGSVARKIRFPTLRDLYDVASGNPDLETEVTQNYEFAIEQELPALATFLTIALYRTDAENFIEKQDVIYQNVEQMRMQGVETTARYTGIEALTLEAGYTFLDAKNTSPDAATEVLQQRPEHKFTLAAARVRASILTLMTTPLSTPASLRISLAPTRRCMAGWRTCSTRTTWNPSASNSPAGRSTAVCAQSSSAAPRCGA